jgi:hypothetical protein
MSTTIYTLVVLYGSNFTKEVYMFKAVFLAIILATSTCFAGLDEILPGTCRVESSKGGIGSGFVYYVDNDAIWILTAGHVVDEADTYTVRFYHETYPSSQFPITIHKQLYEKGTINDMAVLKLAHKDYKDYAAPAILPLAKELGKPKVLYTFGSAGGAWPTGYKGYMVTTNSKIIPGGFDFYPAPQRGRSGSGLFIEGVGKEMFAVGLLITTLDVGSAVPVSHIQNTLKSWNLKY